MDCRAVPGADGPAIADNTLHWLLAEPPEQWPSRAPDTASYGHISSLLMSRPPSRPSLTTVPALVRAFRRWASTAPVRWLPDVAGADDDERRILAALGGIAAGVADDHVAAWPEPIRLWAERSPSPPSPIVEAVCEGLGTRTDPLSALYDAGISPAHRRRLGTVFTPIPVVDHMLDLAAATMDREPVRIVDPGAGVGAFTLAAAKRWPKARVFAVDVNVVTLGLLAARIAFEIDVESEDAEAISRVHLELDDYLHDLGDRFRHARGPVLVLGNPPYTRIQELPTDYRSKAIALGGEISNSGHANLAVLFQAATINHMRAEDASCMVLPGSVSFTRAGLGVRRALWHSERPVMIQRTPATTRPFSGRSVQAAILAVGPVNAQRAPIQFARVRFGADGPEMLEEWEGNRDRDEPSNWFWRKENEDNSADFTLSEIAAIQRGVATGASTMFFLTDAEAERLPRNVIVPAAPTLRRFSAPVMDAAAHAAWGDMHTKRWLLAIPRDYLLDGPLRAYVQQFEAEVRKRFLVSQRKPWYSITSLPQPDILIAPLSKNDFKIVINTVRAVPSNNLFGITMRNGTAPETLADWLRSKPGQRALLRVSRRYHGGSHKLEPGDLKRVRIPSKLTKSST
jgi:adenine-specific DNA-methyltransferase